jgi:hypothetical protein
MGIRKHMMLRMEKLLLHFHFTLAVKEVSVSRFPYLLRVVLLLVAWTLGANTAAMGLCLAITQEVHVQNQ